MLKLLIVEDELIIREGLEHGFDWNEIGYEVCGVACSGKEAISQIKSCCPDVLITDIVMNQTDGLELLQYISQNELNIYSIVLSGYNMFEFVRTAMKYGAFSYLLKPVEKGELFEVLEKLREKIEAERTAVNHSKEMQLIVDISRRDIVEQTMKRFLSGEDTNGEQVQFLLSKCDPRYLSSKYALAALDCSRMFMITLLHKAAIRFFDMCDLCNVIFIPVENMLVMLLCLQEQVQEQVIIKQLLLSLDDCLSRADVRCRITQATSDFMMLPGDFHRLLTACENGFYDDFGETYVVGEKKHETVCMLECLPRLVDLVEDSFKEKKYKNLDIGIEYYLRNIKKGRYNKNIVVDRSCDDYIDLHERLCELYPSLRRTTYSETFTKLSECTSFLQFSRLYRAMLESLFNDVLNVSNEKYSFIHKIKQYIKDNYMNSLSLEELSRIFFLNPAYLSTLFCQFTGTTITSYIRKVRLEKAKELLLTSNMSIQDIAETVGYSSPRYFSNLFKEFFKQTPSNFRMIQRYSPPIECAKGDEYVQKK